MSSFVDSLRQTRAVTPDLIRGPGRSSLLSRAALDSRLRGKDVIVCLGEWDHG
jgi:hypothetical protein